MAVDEDPYRVLSWDLQLTRVYPGQLMQRVSNDRQLPSLERGLRYSKVKPYSSATRRSRVGDRCVNLPYVQQGKSQDLAD
jgi:hypothetical protein